MASGIYIYSFFFRYPKIFWISEKEFVISEILAHKIKISKKRIPDIRNNYFGYPKQQILISEINVYF